MHILILKEPVALNLESGLLSPGDWIVTDQNAAEIALHAQRASWKLVHLKSWLQPHGSVLIIRSGARGDLLFLTAALREFKKQFPERRVGLACFPHHHEMLRGNPDIDVLLNYPLRASETSNFDSLVSLEDVVEIPVFESCVTVFARELGVISVADHVPRYHLTNEERAKAAADFPRTGRPRVCVQTFASSAHRNYPQENWAEVFKVLLERGWEIFLTGSPSQLAKIPTVGPLKKMDRPFRETAAFLTTCDVFAGVDSCWLHLAPAIGLHAIGLFGPVSYKKSAEHIRTTTWLNGTGDCAPCNWIAKGNWNFPPDKPCFRAQKCSVLGSIDPKRVIAKIDAFRKT